MGVLLPVNAGQNKKIVSFVEGLLGLQFLYSFILVFLYQYAYSVEGMKNLICTSFVKSVCEVIHLTLIYKILHILIERKSLLHISHFIHNYTFFVVVDCWKSPIDPTFIPFTSFFDCSFFRPHHYLAISMHVSLDRIGKSSDRNR